MKPETLAARGGAHAVDEHSGALVPPLHTSTTFARGPDYRLLGAASYARDEAPAFLAVEELLRAATQLAADETVKVVFVKGSGPVFCAGADLKERRGMTREQVRERRLKGFAVYSALEALPMPDLSDFTPKSYTLTGKPLTFMITSRSCPHKCSFCSVHTTFGTDYRRRSLDQMLEEIELRYQQGYRAIDFEDDNLTYYKQTFKELCRRLILRFPNRQMEFVAMNGISYLSLDDELLELMYDAGFSHLNLALVSSDKTVRETTKRPHTLEAYVKVVSKAHQLGFKIVSYQILGLPNESLDSMIQTLAFNSRLPVLLGASPFYRTPNSPIARGLELKESDFIKARLTALAIETQSFTRDDIYTLFVTTRIINFLKGLPVDGATNLLELMSRSWSEPRTQIGFDLLKQLSETGRLYFSTARGLVENRKFRIQLFARVLIEIGTIRCQNGAAISVEKFARQLVTSEKFSSDEIGFKPGLTNSPELESSP